MTPKESTIKPRRKQVRKGIKKVEGYLVGRGENQTVIPPEDILKLAKIGCTVEEMADWFQVPASTINYNFSEIIAKGRSELKQSLRKAQIKAALNLQPTLLVWLGKNLLGQSDQPNQTQIDNQILPWIMTEGHKDESNH